MTARRVAQFSFNALAILLLACVVVPLLAQDAATPEIENAKFQATGAINANAVYIRSGASDNDYPTMRLDKGAEVTVVGERFNWLKILPPEGSFCCVAKAYVNRTGNGSYGQVTTALNVRMGSALNTLVSKVVAKLEPNQKVEIIGDFNEYFKIKPPPEVYLYVNKQFVDFVKVNGAAPIPLAAGAAVGAEAAANTESAKPAAAEPEKLAAAPSTQPTTQQTAEANTAPATQPTAMNPEAEFARLEQKYSEITQLPLDEQPVEALLADYQKLSSSDGLPDSMRRICDFKVGVLKGRAELKSQYSEVRAAQETMKTKQMALKAEQQELQQRVSNAQVTVYTAVGTLRTSSLQQGQGTMYRLTDPSNGRTLVYLRSDDAKLGQYIGKFIGVKGEVSSDTQQNIRYIAPTAFAEVEPARIGQSIIAQLVPPSLMPGGGATASTDTGSGQ